MSVPRYLTSHDATATGEFAQLVDGRMVPGASRTEVIDPATGRGFAYAPVADAGQVDQAVAAAARAFPAWSATDHDERAAVLHRLADAIEARAEEIARLVVREQGKPITESRADVEFSRIWLRHVADWRPDREILRDDDEAFVEIVRRPLGVVAAIVPWNFPFFQTVYKLGPALMTGNTVVVKPAPTTPLNAMLLGEMLCDLVPAGVVNVVGDAGAAGPQLTAHPDVAKISFTGSTASGRAVMAAAAPTLKRVTLELGGNDSAVVLADADVIAAAQGVFTWAFANAGQVCISIKRIYVHRSIHDQFCAELARLAEQVVVGPGLDEQTGMGPIHDSRQFEAVHGYLERARDGGTVVAGGAGLERDGYFVRPTVVRDIDEGDRLVQEETFGPVRSVFAYDDLGEVIGRVNATPYGLGNSVWGTDLDTATSVARRLESGTSWVNQHFALAPDVPFGGRKQSGVGSEFGRDGLAAFTDVQVVNVSRAG